STAAAVHTRDPERRVIRALRSVRWPVATTPADAARPPRRAPPVGRTGRAPSIAPISRAAHWPLEPERAARRGRDSAPPGQIPPNIRRPMRQRGETAGI